MHFMKIKNRSTGKLMAEYNEVILYDSGKFISFIEATRITDRHDAVMSCPKKRRFYDFQYDVLKPKQQLE